MSGDILRVGVSGLQVSQAALTTVGHNISNANTPGYSRQESLQATQLPQLRGGSYVGNGAVQQGIRRISQEFQITQLRTDTALYHSVSTVLENVSQLDNLLADENTGIAPGMQSFFAALHNVTDDPSSIPARELLLSQSQSLIDRFQTMNDRIVAQEQAINDQMRSIAEAINGFAAGIAKTNDAIAIASGSADGVQPNDLLDKRDEMLRQLAELVAVQTVEQDDGTLNVFIGKGQSLVVGLDYNRVDVQPDPEDPQRLQMVVVTPTGATAADRQITGGQLGGLVEYRNSILDEARNSLGRLAMVFAETFNKQHQQGLDLNGELGGLFFNDVNDAAFTQSRFIPNVANALPNDRIGAVRITDVSQLTVEDYEIQFPGPGNNNYTVFRYGTTDVVSQGTLSGAFPATIQFDGVEVEFTSGSFQAGDRFTIRPTHFGVEQLSLAITNTRQVALASPVRGIASSSNIGSGVLSAGEILDVNTGFFNPAGDLNPPMVVRFTSATSYDILDNSDPANPVPLNPPMNDRVFIPNTRNNLFTGDPGETLALSDGAASEAVNLAAVNGYPSETFTITYTDPNTGAISLQTATSGVNDSARQIAADLSLLNGVTATASSEAVLSNLVNGGGFSLTLNGQLLAGTDVVTLANSINANATLQGQGITARSDGVSLTVHGGTGEDLNFQIGGTGADSIDIQNRLAATQNITGGNQATVGGRVEVTLASDYALGTSANGLFTATPPTQSTYTGFQFSLSGAPLPGDEFVIEFNHQAASDNRNGLALVALESAGIFDGNTASYGNAYGSLVERVGNFTAQTRISEEASKNLLAQSQASWDATSGVNLDEEAARLIEYELAYNASAQVISVARTLFDTLINAVG